MTYEVTIQNGLLPEEPLYFGGDAEYGIYNDKLTLEVGQAGLFSFVVPANNPSFNKIKERETIVTIYRDNEEWWRGEVREINQLFDMSREIVCYEDIAWLYDADIVPQTATRTYAQWFSHALGKYNSDCAILGSQRASRKFDIGYIAHDSGLSKQCDIGYGTSVMDFLRSQIGDAYGYLRVRRVVESGVQKRYIDIVRLADYGSVINQSIEFGENMLDYVEEADTSNLITGIHPLGSEIDGEEVIPNVAKRVDITSVNSGVDYLVDATSCQKFGWIMKTMIWNDIASPAELKTKAQEYLTENKNPKYTWSLDAVDLSVLDVSIDAISLGSQVQIYAEPFGIDTSVPVTRLDMSITDASKNSIELSDEVRNISLSSQISAANAAMEKMPEESEILHSAKLNALNMLNGAIGGHVIFKFDATNRYVEELIICNASTEEASTQKWVYNLNGWGHMSRESTSDEWSEMSIAATMDGSIVADAIAAGTLTLGNGGSDAPLLQAYSGNTLVTRINRSGLYAIAGQIGGFNITNNSLTINDAILSPMRIGCGSAGYGIINLVGKSTDYGEGNFGYIQISNSGNPSRCLDGIRIYGNGKVVRYDGSGNVSWTKYLSNIPEG